MENERCAKHGITRCPACAFLEAKKQGTLLKAGPSAPTPASIKPVIPGGPPEDIEMMDAPQVADERQRLQAEHDQAVNDLLESKARQEAIQAQTNIQVDEIAEQINGPKEDPYHEVGMDHPELARAVPVNFQEEDGQRIAMPTETAAPGAPAVGINGFDTLPTDDSHASQVMRAAAAYAKAAKMYAIDVAEFTAAKEHLNTLQCRLSVSEKMRDKAEAELKTLVAGGDAK